MSYPLFACDRAGALTQPPDPNEPDQGPAPWTVQPDKPKPKKNLKPFSKMKVKTLADPLSTAGKVEALSAGVGNLSVASSSSSSSSTTSSSSTSDSTTKTKTQKKKKVPATIPTQDSDDDDEVPVPPPSILDEDGDSDDDLPPPPLPSS